MGERTRWGIAASGKALLKQKYIQGTLKTGHSSEVPAPQWVWFLTFVLFLPLPTLCPNLPAPLLLLAGGLPGTSWVGLLTWWAS